MPDRYTEAVRARRAELRALRAALAGGHRAELRTCLALSRIAAAADAEREVARLRREVAEHCETGDRATRAALPSRLAAVLPALTAAVHTRWAAALRPGLRRIATARGLDTHLDPHLGPGRPHLPPPRLPPVVVAVPARRGPAGPLLAGALDGAGLWRLALFPVALLPVLGLPALGGAAFAPLAVGAGVATVGATAAARHTAARRTHLLRAADQAVTAAAAALRADLDRRLVEVESGVGAALDAAVLRRRAAVDAELARLAPDRQPEDARG